MAIPPATAADLPLIERTFGVPRFHTDGDVAALAYDEAGHIWSVEEPGVLRQWDGTGQPLGRWFLVDLETTWSFGPQAKLLAAACDELLIWEVGTRILIARIEVPSWITAVAFHPSLTLVATGHDDGVVRLWNPADEELIAEFSEHELPVSALAFNADGSRLASAGEDRVIKVWDVATRTLVQTLEGHTDRIPAIQWHPDGNFIVSVGWDATARVWDVSTGDPRILLNVHDDQVLGLAFSPDGKLLATADSASTVHIWGDLLAAQALHKLPGYGDEVRALAFRADGKHLAVGGTDRVIHVYDAHTGRLIAGQAADAVHAVAVWPVDGERWIVSNSGDDGLLVWNMESGATRPSPLPAGRYLHVAASADGRWLAATTADAMLHLWDQQNRTYKSIDGPKTPARHLAFAPDGSHVAGAVTAEGTVWIWNLANFEPVLLIIEATEGCSVEAIAYHPGGTTLLCGGVDFLTTSGSTGAVCPWDLVEKKRVHSIAYGATCLCYHPKGHAFAFAVPDGWVHVHASDTGEPILELEGQEEQRVNAVTFSPDGNWLIGAGDDGLLRVWDTTTGDLIAARELPAAVHNVVPLADGRLLIAFGNATVGQVLISRLTEPA